MMFCSALEFKALSKKRGGVGDFTLSLLELSLALQYPAHFQLNRFDDDGSTKNEKDNYQSDNNHWLGSANNARAPIKTIKTPLVCRVS